MSSLAAPDPGSVRQRGLTGVIAWAAMLVLLAGLAAFALFRPAGNADIVDYVATAHSWQGLSGQALSDATYGDLRAFLTPGQFDNVTGAGDKSQQRNVYLATMAADPVSLAQQIPYYAVKPLYPALMLALHAVGVPLPLSTLLISVVSYVLLGVLLFAWMRRHHRPLVSFVLAGLLVASPPFAALINLSTPDALGLLLLASAVFAFVELRRPPLALVLLAVSLLARPNGLIFALLLVAAGLMAAPSSGVRLRLPVALGAAAAFAAVVFLVSRVVGAYPYAVLFTNALIEYTAYPANGVAAIAIKDLARLYVLLAAQLTVTFIPLMSLLAVIALRLRVPGVRAIRGDGMSLLVVTALLAAAGGWLVFPNEPDRMLVGSYLTVAVVLAASSGLVMRARHAAPEPALPEAVEAAA